MTAQETEQRMCISRLKRTIGALHKQRTGPVVRETVGFLYADKPDEQLPADIGGLGRF